MSGAASTSPNALRSPTGRGRPYRPEAVAAVRGLIEGTTLPYREIADRTGVPRLAIARWSRRFGWPRPAGGVKRTARNPDGNGDPAHGHEVQRLARKGPHAHQGGPRWRRRYGPDDVEAARAAIEGSRASLEQIERELGISTATLIRWRRRHRWRRPGPPPGARPRPVRFKTVPGRPYAADAVGAVQHLATNTNLSQKRIAERVGIAQATVSSLIKRRGWARPPVGPGDPRFDGVKRTAPTATSGDRRGRPYADETVAAARELYGQTRLSMRFIAARVKVGPAAVARWARTGGWTRPSGMPDPRGRYRRRRWPAEA